MNILIALALLINLKNDVCKFTIKSIEYHNAYYMTMNYELKNLNYENGIILPRTLDLALNYESIDANVKIYNLKNHELIKSKTQADIMFMPDLRQDCSANTILFKSESISSFDDILLADTPIPKNTPCVFFVAIKIKDCSGNNLFIQSDPFYFKFDGNNIKEINVGKSKKKIFQ